MLKLCIRAKNDIDIICGKRWKRGAIIKKRNKFALELTV